MLIDLGLFMNIYFDDLVEVIIIGNVFEYEVYYFWNCIRKSNDVCLEKVSMLFILLSFWSIFVRWVYWICFCKWILFINYKF